MSDTTFTVSEGVVASDLRQKVDYIKELRTAFRRPIEATWLPPEPLIACDSDHALLSAMRTSFYQHFPLRLSPDAIWITLARGFALHVNEHSERLRHHFVAHAGQQDIEVRRRDFLPGEDNPWPEAFDEFSEQIVDRTGGLGNLVQANFSTTGPVERAVSSLMAMETFKTYFKYLMYCGCGIPRITLTGTVEDWQSIRERVQAFSEFGLEDWTKAIDPILDEFVRAKLGQPNVEFWQSMFRYNSGSGPAVMTGWANLFFPYLKNHHDELYANPYLADWQERLSIDDRQTFQDRMCAPQGVGLASIPACLTSVPVTVYWGKQETAMQFVGGLMGVTQNSQSLEIEPQCGWAVLYDQPVDPLSTAQQAREDRIRNLE